MNRKRHVNLGVILKPAVVLMNRLNYMQKFLFIGIVLFIPLMVMIYTLIQSLQTEIQVKSVEKQGIAHISTLNEYLVKLQEHRSLSNRLLKGEDAAKEPLAANETALYEISNRINKFTASTDIESSEQWSSLITQWDEFTKNPGSPLDSMEFHRNFTNDFMLYMKSIANQYELILNPDIDSYYLIDSVVNNLPPIIDKIGQAGTLAYTAVNDRNLSVADKSTMISLYETTDSYSSYANYSLQISMKNNKLIEDKLGQEIQNMNDAIQNFQSTLNKAVINGIPAFFNSETFKESLTLETVTSVDKFYQADISTINQILDESQHNAIWNRNMLLIAIVIVAFVVMYLCLAFYRSVKDTIRSLESAANHLATGDLTARVHLNTKDELRTIGSSFNAMSESFTRMVQLNQDISKRLAVSSKELQVVSGELTDSGSMTASNMQQIADIAEIQKQTSEEVAASMEQMSLGVQQIAESAGIVSELSISAEQQVEHGKQTVDQAFVQMEALHNITDQMGHVMNELNDQSKKVGDIVGFIADIANQTNMLSLNAAIEAARAGVHGKGFAVVAGEVKKLAEQTKQSSSHIQELITIMQRTVNKAVACMKENTSYVQQGQAMMHQVNEVFLTIATNTQVISDKLQEVSATTEQMSASTEEVNASMEQTVATSHNVFLSTKNVSEITDKQLATMESVSESAKSLGTIVEQLQLEINKFKV
ncbi:HAMP domain-containing protein [Paenibacillus albiflavus]|uniref:HAMP domain-containing protein n=1 Tax=Paenibacillus albiflavus TaxID=2545760 RepID=A0A4V6P6A9_9BACL|nr:HAMP domain-containing methyl-accepting chemotaxis protein [Paenibacillus albiflavus]TCZ76322.1 HAMP domain-containing protein [Paenibacillus albiflavus]